MAGFEKKKKKKCDQLEQWCVPTDFS
jgi:hypothetical protein